MSHDITFFMSCHTPSSCDVVGAHCDVQYLSTTIQVGDNQQHKTVRGVQVSKVLVVETTYAVDGFMLCYSSKVGTNIRQIQNIHSPIENRCSILEEDIWYGDCTTIGAGGTLKLFSKS